MRGMEGSVTEYIGYKDPVGDGLCNMGLTEEEVIRCRDCEHSIRSNGDWFCFQLHKVYGDPTYIESWRMLETKPDGYCAWAARRS